MKASSLPLLFALLLPIQLRAADNFSYTATSGSQSTYEGFGGFSAFSDSLKTANLLNILTGYTTNSAANFTALFRGVPVNMSYATNSPVLNLVVPSLGINLNFNGTTRDDSQQQFSDFLKSNGQGILDKLLKEAALLSPNDPVAGNPNSMMGGLVSQSFEAGFTSVESQAGSAAPTQDDRSNLIGVGLQYNSVSSQGTTSRNYTLPFSHTWRFESDPRMQLKVSLPLTYGRTEGASVYSASPTVTFAYPINEHWTLTPVLGYGLTGSVDLASAAQMLSESLMSMYTFRFENGWSVSSGNMVGHFQTLRFTYHGYSTNPGIENEVFRNGVMVAQPIYLFGRKALEYSLVDTRYVGTDLFLNGYDELGLTIGTVRSETGLRRQTRLGLAFLLAAKSTRGISGKFGYWF